MKVEIWSDIMCPFCYLGKTKFEQALEKFDHRAEMKIVWRSFQLSPHLKTDPRKSAVESLAEHKGQSLRWAQKIQSGFAKNALSYGLHYDFENQVVANTFKAHRLTYLAKEQGQQTAMMAAIFKAYFSEGRNIDDNQVLIELACQVGLDPERTSQCLESEEYQQEVQNDINLARQNGINGVPFFIFDDKWAISGAQEPAVFLDVLNRIWEEHLELNS